MRESIITDNENTTFKFMSETSIKDHSSLLFVDEIMILEVGKLYHC
jgi:hypothetical protein